ncbi:hypothetical protein FB451DRAFT_1421493 [Mycena latifolia]|nr:hypothetical protein FB451DRAFT_1421493 [Mycena latifolia]
MDNAEDKTLELFNALRDLEEQIAEANENHEDTVLQLQDRVDALRWERDFAHGLRSDVEAQLLERKHQLYDLRQLVVRVGRRLIARERHTSTETIENQLAETKRFIQSVGGQLLDGIHATAAQSHRRTRLESDSEPEGEGA